LSNSWEIILSLPWVSFTCSNRCVGGNYVESWAVPHGEPLRYQSSFLGKSCKPLYWSATTLSTKSFKILYVNFFSYISICKNKINHTKNRLWWCAPRWIWYRSNARPINWPRDRIIKPLKNCSDVNTHLVVIHVS
jgi:hypothetical protein